MEGSCLCSKKDSSLCLSSGLCFWGNVLYSVCSVKMKWAGTIALTIAAGWGSLPGGAAVWARCGTRGLTNAPIPTSPAERCFPQPGLAPKVILPGTGFRRRTEKQFMRAGYLSPPAYHPRGESHLFFCKAMPLHESNLNPGCDWPTHIHLAKYKPQGFVSTGTWSICSLTHQKVWSLIKF